MSTAGPPEGSAPKLTLPHGDPVAVEVISAIHRGDLDALRSGTLAPAANDAPRSTYSLEGPI
jgi:hypothetical protein